MKIDKEKKVAFISDDLTGANDCGVQFSKRGITTTVYVKDDKQSDNKNEVLVYDTDSRSLHEKKAFQRVFQLGQDLKKLGIPVIQKKIDSTLRGNIGAESKALFDIGVYDFALIVPANPRLGRRTINGIHYVNNKKISDTEFVTDLKTPVKHSNVVTLLEEQLNEDVGLIRTSELGTDEESWKTELSGLLQKGYKYLVCDVTEENDLKKIVEMTEKLKYVPLWVASSGVTKYLAEKRSFICPFEDINVSEYQKQTLVVSGTRSKVTEQQINHALEFNHISQVKLEVEKLIDDSTDWQELKRELVNRIELVFDGGHNVILNVAEPKNNSDPVPIEGFDNLITKSLAEIVAEVIDDKDLGLVLTGGDTARAVCEELGVYGILLHNEVEEGIPKGELLLPDRKRQPVVTKAGAYGTETALLNIIAFYGGGVQIG